MTSLSQEQPQPKKTAYELAVELNERAKRDGRFLELGELDNTVQVTFRKNPHTNRFCKEYDQELEKLGFKVSRGGGLSVGIQGGRQYRKPKSLPQEEQPKQQTQLPRISKNAARPQ